MTSSASPALSKDTSFFSIEQEDLSLFDMPGSVLIAAAPEGQDALILADLLKAGRDVIHIARDEARMVGLRECLSVFAPDLDVLCFPAWDCLPYDRVSPRSDVLAQRMDVLTDLARLQEERAITKQSNKTSGVLVLTTVAGILQKLPARDMVSVAWMSAMSGDRLDPEDLTSFLNRHGYQRVETVSEAGEYAIRGGIFDLFPPGAPTPLRLDFFGDTLESIRSFDALTQRSTGKLPGFALKPASEIDLNEASIQRFRQGYRSRFGTSDGEDPLYEAISVGQKFGGMEHWLPLFHERMETLCDYVPDAILGLDHQVEDAVKARWDMVRDYYAARKTMLRAGTEGQGYKPLAPQELYFMEDAWALLLSDRSLARFSPFDVPESPGEELIPIQARQAHDFSDARNRADVNLFEAVKDHIKEEQAKGRRVALAAYSEGSRDRLMKVLGEHELANIVPVESWQKAEDLTPMTVALLVLPIEHGFRNDKISLIGEQDILGDRLARTNKKRKKSDHFLTELGALSEGDLVVHIQHGIGRYQGLETIDVGGAPHDCLCVIYDGGDKLYVPVENMEVLSRYSAADAQVTLDKLGGAAWQARKAKVKDRIREIANELIKVAAQRELRKGRVIHPPEGLYQEFAARFPYPETEDQLKAIEDIVNDFSSGKPMDRLICGDVGFGKTEVALRAAFIGVMTGMQVAIVVPTTLLARQHYRTFSERFKGLPVRVEQLSRFVSAKQQNQTKADMKDGKVDIVVGTHALLGKTVGFRDLGLLVIDEEQHFGVKQKERLKQMRAEVHVLTLTATPIPRTLQLAMSGVREMSIIATPPVDRLAVRTFVMPFDGVVAREAIMREKMRGGQSFVVCPRVSDLAEMREKLEKLIPEARLAMAHGQMAAKDLDDVMNAFYDGSYDILLATNIVESGLDVPTANTMILHRADMFGLAQLYQIRGRIGRSKQRAYCYLTLPPGRKLNKTAEKRLNVMQTLDTLGAGFTLASHDLDIRGAGNLLGDEQSGHVKEVGIELYQQMLEEAVAAARDAGEGLTPEDQEWVPAINLGMSVLIPETYIADLNLRLAMYRRLSSLTESKEINAIGAEMIDRFGPLPAEVENLLKIIAIKQLCRRAGVEKLDAGPKGAVIAFRNNEFAHPEKLIKFISKQAGSVKLRPDHKLVYQRGWDDVPKRVQGSHKLMKELAKMVKSED